MSTNTRPCEICGQPIDPERIEVKPETRLCVKHAHMIEKYGGEFIVTATQASLGKDGSLKKTTEMSQPKRIAIPKRSGD
jgi:hypothetical protein